MGHFWLNENGNDAEDCICECLEFWLKERSSRFLSSITDVVVDEATNYPERKLPVNQLPVHTATQKRRFFRDKPGKPIVWVIGADLLDNNKCKHFKNSPPSVNFRIGQINPHPAGSTLTIELKNDTRPINLGRGRESDLGVIHYWPLKTKSPEDWVNNSPPSLDIKVELKIRVQTTSSSETKECYKRELSLNREAWATHLPEGTTPGKLVE